VWLQKLLGLTPMMLTLMLLTLMIVHFALGQVLGKGGLAVEIAVLLAVLLGVFQVQAWVVLLVAGVVAGVVCRQLAQCWAVMLRQARGSKLVSGGTTVNLQAGCLGEAHHLKL